MALKDWKKASRIIIKDLENEGDNVLNVWSNKKTQENIFIIKSPRGYILGKKGLSQMCTPKLLKKPKTKAQALNFAKDYMETHPKIAKIKTKKIGWKQFQKNHWKNKSKGNVRVLNINEFKSDIRDKRTGFVVYANMNDGFFGNPYGKIFKTETLALKKAKDYMKKQ